MWMGWDWMGHGRHISKTHFYQLVNGKNSWKKSRISLASTRKMIFFKKKKIFGNLIFFFHFFFFFFNFFSLLTVYIYNIFLLDIRVEPFSIQIKVKNKIKYFITSFFYLFVLSHKSIIHADYTFYHGISSSSTFP